LPLHFQVQKRVHIVRRFAHLANTSRGKGFCTRLSCAAPLPARLEPGLDGNANGITYCTGCRCNRWPRSAAILPSDPPRSRPDARPCFGNARGCKSSCPSGTLTRALAVNVVNVSGAWRLSVCGLERLAQPLRAFLVALEAPSDTLAALRESRYPIRRTVTKSARFDKILTSLLPYTGSMKTPCEAGPRGQEGDRRCPRSASAGTPQTSLLDVSQAKVVWLAGRPRGTRPRSRPC
jgi:hypothetical protein